MPQLNPEFFLSQVFWLIITFSFLLIFLWRVSLPRINYVLEKRENKINDDINTAKNIQAEAEKIQIKIDLQLHGARELATESIKESTNKLQNILAKELQKTQNELTNKIDESAKSIENNKNNALENIKTQIQEITKLTLSKLTTINVSNKEIQETLLTIENEKIN